MSVIVLDDGRVAEKTSPTILGFIQNGGEVVRLESDETDLHDAKSIADNWIANQRDRKRTIIKEQNEALVSARSAAIERSYGAKINRIQKAD